VPGITHDVGIVFVERASSFGILVRILAIESGLRPAKSPFGPADFSPKEVSRGGKERLEASNNNEIQDKLVFGILEV
jgi:hypothetical protein